MMTPEKQRAAQIKKLTDDSLETALRIFGSIGLGSGILAGLALNLISMQSESPKLSPMGIACIISGAVLFCLCFGIAKILEQNSFIIKERHKDEFSK